MKHINNKDKGYKFIALVAFLFLLFSICYAEAAEYNAGYTPGSITCINAGQTKTVSVTLKNMGTLPWNPGTTFLSYHLYQGGAYPVWDGERTSLSKSVAPKETITLNAKVTANVPVGSCTIEWDMLGPTTWFSLKSPPVPTGNQTVEVKSNCFPMQLGTKATVQSAGAAADVSHQLGSAIRAQVQSPGALKSIDLLCQNIDCSGEEHPVQKPVVAPEFVPTFIHPGNYAGIGGRNFGAAQGHVNITGKFDNGQSVISPTIEEWKDWCIEMRLDPMTGVRDQKVKLQVITKDGLASDPIEIPFRATRDLAFFPYNRMRQEAGEEGYLPVSPCLDEYCGWQSYKPKACDEEWKGCGICKGHLTQGDRENRGTDQWKAKVKNGWTFEGRIDGWGSAGNCKVENPEFTLDPTKSVAQIRVVYNVDACWELWCSTNHCVYVGWLPITGPKGLSPY